MAAQTDIEVRLGEIERRLDALIEDIAYIKAKQDSFMTVIKYVIVPLISIVAALAGVKVIFP